MTNNRILALLAAFGLFVGVGYAIAQTYPPPFVQSLNQAADAVPIVSGGRPQAPSYYATPAQLDSVYGYIKQSQAESSGALTVTLGNSVSYLLLTGSQLTSGTVTINFPGGATPNDGQKFCLRSVSGVTSGATIAYGPSGPTFTTTPTSLTAATSYCYLFSASNSTWDPI